MEAEQVTNFAVSVEPWSVSGPAPLSESLSMTAQCITPFVMKVVRRLKGLRPRCYVGGLDEFGVRNDPDAHPFAYAGITMEQTLNPDSRVSVSDAKDAFGLNRLRLDWQLTEADYRTILTAALAYGAHVAEQDVGRARLRDWLLGDPVTLPGITSGNGMVAGRQHMCTTRMSADPRTGVVDRDCRVHGVSNFYVGGSSVFATPGFAKPTYTIVQLALRLGDHLGGMLAA
jgi:hypothetical protein